MKNFVTALLLTAGVAFPYVVGLHVEPVKAEWSGWTPSQYPNNFVSQMVTCNFDSLSYVELFAGARGNSGYYHVAVYDSGSLVMWSDGQQDWDSRWVRFEDWDRQATFTKGKQYEFRFNRMGSSPIQFYWGKEGHFPIY